MIGKFFKDGFLYSLANIVSFALAFFLVPIYTAYFSPEDYGVLDIYNILVNIFAIVISFQIIQGVARFQHESNDNSMEYLSSAFFFILVLYLLFVVLSIVVNLDTLFGDRKLSNLVPLILTSAFASKTFILLTYHFRNIGQSKLYSLVTILNSILSIATVLFLAIIKKMGIYGVFYGGIISNSFFSIISYFLIRHKAHSFSLKKTKQMLKFSTPLIFVALGAVLLNYADRFVLLDLLGLKNVGVYGIGYKISNVVNIAFVSFSGALTPLIYSNYKSNDTPDKIAEIFRLFLGLIISIVIAVSIFSHEILIVFTQEEYYNAKNVIPFLSISLVMLSLQNFFPGYTLTNKTKVLPLFNFFTIALNLGLNYILIPLLGIVGAAVGSMASSIILMILMYKGSQKLYYIPFRNKIKIKPVVIGVIVFISLIVISNYLYIPILYLLILKFLILILFVVWLFLTKLVTVDDFRKIKYKLLKKL